MKKRKKKFLIICAACFFCLDLVGCRGETPLSSSASEEAVAQLSGGESVLTVCTEEDMLSEFVYDVAQYYRTVYPNVKIQIEKLTKDAESREDQIKRLQVEIMAGGGPDIFLLPSGQGGLLVNYQHLKPLFQNVNKTLGTGAFYDLNEMMAKDAAFQWDEFISPVMDAGVVSGKRYALPLSYLSPLLVAMDKESAALGFFPEEAGKGYQAFMNLLAGLEQPPLSTPLLYFMTQLPLNGFINPIDYQKESLTITQMQLTEFVTAYGAFAKTATTELEQNNKSILAGCSAPMDTFQTIAAAKQSGESFSVYPIAPAEGKAEAAITTFGAINASCANKAEAYAFLKLFCRAEIQSGVGLQTEGSEKVYGAQGIFRFFGWPVRKDVSVESLWNNMGYDGFYQGITLTEKDFLLPGDNIASAHFYSDLDSEFRTMLLGIAENTAAGKTPGEETLNALCEEYYRKMAAAAQE